MPADVIQAQYDQLKTVADRFAKQAEAHKQMQQRVSKTMNTLQSGWQGKGSAAFFGEINGKVLPVMKRMEQALTQAQAATIAISQTVKAAEEEAARPFRGGEKSSVPLQSGETKKSGGFWNKVGEWVHTGLDVVGFIPGVGEVADGANALIYLAEGRKFEAAISAAAMIPVVGDLGKSGRLAVKIGKEIAEESAEKAVKGGVEQIVQKGAERTAKESVENLSETGTRQLSREERLPALATDPAHKGKPPLPKTLREAEVGLNLEQAGKFPGPIIRDPSGAAEFIDKSGQKWDVKTFHSGFPPKKGGFLLERDVAKIEAEIAKGENVILDTYKLSSEHIQQLQDEMQKRGLSDKILWYP